jgi:hypothetical protein
MTVGTDKKTGLNTGNKGKTLSQIDKLTPEQEAKIPEYRAKWTQIGTSCEPCDFEKSKEFAILTYRQSDIEPPKSFHLCDSPIQAANLAADLKVQYKLAPKNMSKDERKKLVQECYEEQIYGYHEASWLSYYDFMLTELGIEECEKLTGLMGMAQNCGWWSPYSENAIFQHRHTACHLNAENQLHCEDGPAVHYRDNTSIWMINGIGVDEQIVMAPETQTIDQINNETNQDVRSLRIDRFGWVNYLRISKAKCIDERHNDVEGTKEALYTTKLGDTRLVVTCPTGRLFALGVPKTIKSCEQAQSWLGPQRKVNVIGRT